MKQAEQSRFGECKGGVSEGRDLHHYSRRPNGMRVGRSISELALAETGWILTLPKNWLIINAPWFCPSLLKVTLNLQALACTLFEHAPPKWQCRQMQWKPGNKRGKLYEQGQQNSNGNEEWVLGIGIRSTAGLIAAMSMLKCFSTSVLKIIPLKNFVKEAISFSSSSSFSIRVVFQGK